MKLHKNIMVLMGLFSFLVLQTAYGSPTDQTLQVSPMVEAFAEQVAEYGPYRSWTVEQKYLFDLQKNLLDGSEILHGIPNEDDVSMQEAKTLTLTAIVSRGFIDSDHSDQYDCFVDFYALSEHRFWAFHFSPNSKIDNSMYVEVDASSKEILVCKSNNDEYPEVQDKKSEILESASHLGISVAQQKKFVAIAREEIVKKFGVSEKAISGFSADIFFDKVNNRWLVTVVSFEEQLFEAYGTFEVHISVSTEEVTDIIHSSASNG